MYPAVWRSTIYVTRAAKRITAMVDLMSLEEQVDREFTVARRRTLLRRLRGLLYRKAGRRTLLSFEERRREIRAYGGVWLGGER
jgi:hypothetical protein